MLRQSPPSLPEHAVLTFSLVARCPRTGRFAVAVASSSPAVAARCAYARAGAGACVSQNVTDPRLGARALDLLALGATAEDVIRILRDTTTHATYRQIAVVDRSGHVAAYSGRHALGTSGVAYGEGCVSAGNLLAGPAVPRAVVATFESMSEADLGDRMVEAMKAGLVAGGEAGPIRSAGLLIVDAVPWPVADLRIDWHDAPLAALAELWTLWKPQMADYVTRALDPASAPSYGVPGDE